MSVKDGVFYQMFVGVFLRFMKRADFCRNHTGTALHKPFEITYFISFGFSPAGIIMG